jgi:molecular chaperone GrpE
MGRGPDGDRDRSGRRRVRVTDKRRVRPGSEEGPEAVGGDAPADAGSAMSSQAGELERARAEAAEYLSHLQRLKAEFDNYRKRILKEQTRAVEVASEGLVRRLLEVLDEFELALVSHGREEDDRFLRGVEIIYAKLMDILKAEGLERIEAQGKPFDPELHEALLRVDGEAGGDGEPVVVDVLRTGYTLRGRVLRPAGVKVGTA